MAGPIEPYLKYGVTCEKVLQEKDGVLSLIRIIDKFVLTITGKEPPNELPPEVAPLTIVMGWAGGLGSHEASFSITRPDGTTQKSPQTWSFHLDALHRGHSIILSVPVEVTKAGVYWIEFILNGEVKGRTPFQVVYQRQQAQV